MSLAVLAVLAAASCGARSVAAAPGWHVVKIISPGSQGSAEDLLSVSAPAVGIAWVAGLYVPKTSMTNRLAVERWNGKAWAPVLLPRVEQPADWESILPPPVVAASSGTEAWVYSPVSRKGVVPAVATVALHWDGRKWTGSAFPAGVLITSAVSLGSTGSWAFGWRCHGHDVVLSFGLQCRGSTWMPYDLHFDGRVWHKVALPGAPLAASASSATSMWAVGPTAATAGESPRRWVLTAMHWNGRSWRTVAVPAINWSAGPGLVGGGAQASQSVAGDPVVAAGPDNVWWAYLINNDNGKETSSGLLHWDGTTWHRTSLPARLMGIGGMAQDGHGGIWLAADSDFYHYGDGHWTRHLLPKGQSAITSGIATIPGTTAMWAIGSADGLYGRNKSFGLILGYGG